MNVTMLPTKYDANTHSGIIDMMPQHYLTHSH